MLAVSQDQQTLSYADFINIVEANHPILSQIKLLDDKSNAYLLKAKGYTDPTVDFDISKKSFDGKKYYRKIDGGIKIPTRIGIELEAGYENNIGQFLDNESTLPGSGLLSAGIKLPIGNGLRYDERRKVLDEAKLIAEKNELKQIEAFNKVLFSATKGYIDWQNNYQKLLLYRQANIVALQSFGITKEVFSQGVGTAMDTIEAQLNLDQRKASLTKAELDYYTSKQMLNTYLWEENNSPLELRDEIIPEILQQEKWIDQVATLQLSQDERINSLTPILGLALDRSQLDLDRRLEKENLKPVIDLKYNPLFRVDENNRFLSYSTSDYKAGVQVYYPLFARKARGNVQLIDIEIENLDLTLPQVNQNIQIQLNNLMQIQLNVDKQINIAQKNIVSATRLFEAETIKFSIGESSLFLLNSREQKKLSFELKAIELTKELLKQRAAYIYLLQAY